MSRIVLPTNDDGTGTWTIVHPDLGPLYHLTVELDDMPEGLIDPFILTLHTAREDGREPVEVDYLSAVEDDES
jgi:hypothetical protein